MARIRRSKQADETISNETEIETETPNEPIEIETHNSNASIETESETQMSELFETPDVNVEGSNELNAPESGNVDVTPTPPVKEPTFNEKLEEFVKELNEHKDSGSHPFAATLLSMWEGLEPSFRNLEEIHNKLSYKGPTDSEMRDKRAASEDAEVKAWNAEIERLEEEIRGLKLAANRKIEGANFIEPLTQPEIDAEKATFVTVKTSVKTAIDGFAAVMAMNNEYMKEFTDFLLASIPDLRSSGATKAKPATASTDGGAKGRKPFFDTMVIEGTVYDKLARLRSALNSNYGYNGDAYDLRVLAESHGASKDNPSVEIPLKRKHSDSTVTMQLAVNYDSNWDVDKLAHARKEAA